MTRLQLVSFPNRITGNASLRRQLKTMLLGVLLSFSSFTQLDAQCELTLTATNLKYPTCGASDGLFQVQASGIVAPYQYTLYKEVGGSFVSQTTGTLIAGTLSFLTLTGGTYKVEVNKGGTCSGSVTVALPQQELTLTATNLKYPTCGANDGLFQVQASGIVAPYQYTLYKEVGGSFVSQTTGTLIAGTLSFLTLTGGTYKVEVNKGGDCSGSVTVALPQEELTLTATNLKYPSCGGNDGLFQVQASGIVAPYQYTLYKEVGGSFVSQTTGTLIAGTLSFLTLTGGTYKIEVNKGGDCSGSVTVALPQQELTLTATNLKYPTCGASDGLFQVQASGIVAPYQYTLYKEVGGSFVSQTTGTLIAGTLSFLTLTGGTYKVEVNKGGTCSGSVTVALPQQELTLTATNLKYPTCGASDGLFQVQASGIVAPYQYTLYKEVGGSFVSQTTGTLIAGTLSFLTLTGGTYKVEVNKGGTCSGSVTVALPQQELTLVPVNLHPPSCGGSDGSFQVQTSGIVVPYQYKLLKEVGGSFVSQQTGTLIAGTLSFIGLSDGTYQVQLDKAGSCSGNATVHLYCEAIGREGCGPGYWKNNLQAWTITNFSASQTVEDVFDVPDDYQLDDKTLLELLQDGGGRGTAGAARILLGAATAAILNAAHRDVDYSKTLQYVISSTNTSLASGNRKNMEQLAKELDKYNNLNCPLTANMITGLPASSKKELPVAAEGLRLKAMPNPSAGAFTLLVETDRDERVSLRIMDMQGRQVEQLLQLPSNNMFRFGENYAPGMYLAEVIQGKERKQVKLVKIR